MYKHTAGPWLIIPGGDEWSQGRIATIEPKPETMIETNYWTVAEVNNRRDERESNARLISAAPDLLAAAERVLAKLDHPTLGLTIYDADALRDAIAKARGEA